MFNEDTHKVLSLFAAMVAADKRVYAVEIEMFMQVTIEFFEKTNIATPPSQARLLMWFDLNREIIQSKLTQRNFESWFEDLLSHVSDVYPAEYINQALDQIACADGELHISEKALMVLVEKYWQRAA